MTVEKIRGKVAAIITSTSLVINRGQVHGVKVGMKFGIFYAVGPIRDPDDPENTIESLTFRKGTVSVTRIYDKMCYCSIDPLRVITRMDTFTLSSLSTSQTVYPEVQTPMYTGNEKQIRVGDPAELVEETTAEAKKP